jgi:hypothetical protein
MAAIDFGRMERVLTRCGELAQQHDTATSVKTVYADKLEPEAKEYLEANRALPRAESSLKKENREAVEHLELIDQPYREARSVYLAYFEDAPVPDTLKTLPTLTDRKNAIEFLLDLIDDHEGETWADEILAGPFGDKASKVVQEIDEATTANTDLSAARKRRAEAFGRAYDAYLAFKNVVRNAHGSKSPQYRRIHLRSKGTFADEAPASGEGA